MKKPFVYHPFLFALFPIMFLWSQNTGRIFLPEMFISMGGMAVITTLLWFLVNLPIRDIHKSGFVVSLFILFFFSYGSLLSMVTEAEEALALWIICISFFIFISLFVLRTRRNLSVLSTFLNVTAISLITLQVLILLPGYGRILVAANSIKKSEHAALTESRSMVRPNIYYIILDAYGREDTLKRVFSYDNTDLLNYLRRKHFYVADKSNANYPLTQLSLASSLNFDYLDPRAFTPGQSIDSFSNLVGTNKVMEVLKSRGYMIVTLNTTAQIGYSSLAEIHIRPRFGFPVFKETLVEMTPLSYVFKNFLFRQTQAHRRKILFALTYLDNVRSVRKPVFVFAHILCPHPPFVFDREGRGVHDDRKFTYDDCYYLTEEIGAAEYRREYREQMIFLNRVVKAAIDEILSQARGPLVIILQGDHGPRSTGNWDDLRTVDFSERMGILNACFFSDQDYSRLYDTITPVNTFRIVFNKYFHAGYPLLPDRSYYVSLEHLFPLHDVSKMLKRKPLMPILPAKTLPSSTGIQGRRKGE